MLLHARITKILWQTHLSEPLRQGLAVSPIQCNSVALYLSVFQPGYILVACNIAKPRQADPHHPLLLGG